MHTVSRWARRLLATVVGVGTLVTVGCGDIAEREESAQPPSPQEDARPEDTRLDQDEAGLEDANRPPEWPIPPTRPTVTLLSPGAGSFLRGTVMLEADAFSEEGIMQVEFLDGSTLIGTATDWPYVLNWDTTTAAPGTHTLKARAFDWLGNVATSSLVSVMVDNSPPVILSGSPIYNPTTLNYVRGYISVGWTVTDQGLSGVALVQMLQDGSWIATAGGHPGTDYSFSWDTRLLENRPYELSLRATDNAGNVQMFYRSVIVDNLAPWVALTSPANGAVVSGVVTLSANASDSQALYYVAYEIDGVLQTPYSTTPPFSKTWSTTGLSGTHTITAIAYDRAGNSQRSTATVFVP